MKKLYSIFPLLLFIFGAVLFVRGNATAQGCSSTISSYPYFQNFEAGAGGWTSGGITSSWALGTPAKTVINSAASGTKSWVTGLTTNYYAGEQSYVASPCFNTTSLILPVIEMKIWWNSEFSFDGAVLQSSIDGGITWQKVGAKGDPFNWYNDNTIGGVPGWQPAGSAEGWTGRLTSNNGSGGWVTARHVLTGLGGKTSVKLRIAFGADGGGNDDGFAFDDVKIYDSPANDAGVSAITNPTGVVVPNVSTPVTVTLSNYGTTALTAATLGFSVNGTTVVNNYAYTGNLAINQTSAPITIGNYTFPAGNNKIKAWSRLPNSATDGTPINDTATVMINTCTLLAGTYTINKNQPASATNYQSFTAAIQALTTCGISAPVTFNVVAGTGPYIDQLIIPNIKGTSATNTITFNGNANTLLNPMANGDALKLDGAKYIRFNNLKIEAASGATGGAIVLLSNGSQNNIFTGCTFTHNAVITLTSYVINVATGSSDNIFQNNTLIGGYYAVYNTGSSSLSNNNNQFIGNIIKDPYNYGFYCMYGAGTLIEGNDISRATRSNAGNLYGIYISTNAFALTISKNRIHNTHDAATATSATTVYGIYSSSSGAVGSETIIKNNAIYNINNAGGTFYGFYNNNTSHTYYYHNTVVADNPNITYNILRGIHFSGASANVKFINNIFSLSSPATTKHAMYIANAGISLVSNSNNLFVGSTGNIGYFPATAPATPDKPTLADWKAVNSNAYDQASVSADPQFVSLATGNLKPINAALNNIGLPVTPAVSDDITGGVRSTTTPDLGAYEFTPAANDAGLTTILSPVSPVVPNASQPVTVTLKNYGLSPLTAATITWSVNGTAQTTYNWTGNLANNQTVNATIGNYTFPAGTFTLDACATLPNGQADQNPGNDCQAMTVISCTPLTGTYTINKNAAASATNFVSFTSAVTILNSCGVTGPVTFNVVAGSGPYVETIELTNIAGASATNTITFNGNANTLSGPSVTADVIVKLNGAKYIRFNNLKIEEHINATTGSVVMLMNAAMNNTFNGCTLTHNTSSTAASQCVNIANGSGNNTFQNNTIIGSYYGVINLGTSTSTNNGNIFTGNTLKDQFYYGFYLGYTAGSLIENNDISRPSRTNGTTLIAINATTGNTGLTISKNRIHNTHDAFIGVLGAVYGVYSTSSGTVGNENIVKNNIIYNLNNQGGSVYGFNNGGASNTYYYHNTVLVDYPNITYGTVRGISFTTAATNVKFINNIISLTGNANAKHCIYLPSTVALTSNNNDLYVGASGNIGYFTTDKATLADWKAVNSNAYDQASVSLDPLFMNQAVGNLRPTLVAVNDLGQPVPGVTDDITGAVRSTTTPDMGAFEFSINQNDVGIVGVSGPSATGCGLSATETITVTIKNFGAVTQTSVPVSYTINGTGLVNETYIGSIAANTTATYSFTAKANLATSGAYAIVAQTNLTGDNNASNNDSTLNITNSLIPSLPMTFDFETAATGIGRFRKVTNPKSNIVEDVAASNGTGSTKGMIMDGVDHAAWMSPVGLNDPWISNPDNFSAAYICISPAGTGAATDSLQMTFDLKQLFKNGNVNTNFRVTVNGTQVGPTYRPPFDPTNPATPIVWKKIRVDLTQYKNDPSVQIGLESSVKEAYANGTGTANLIDNIEIKRVAVQPQQTGVKDAVLTTQVNVFPNPSKGIFNVELPKGKTYELVVTDLTGKVLKKQTVNGSAQLNLEGTAKGIYLLNVTGEKGSAVCKLIVE